MKFTTEADLTSDWIAYVQFKSIELSKVSDFQIESSADVELLRPDIKEFLTTWEDDEEIEEIGLKSLSLGFEAGSVANSLKEKGKFKKLKEKIRKIACTVLKAIVDPESKLGDVIAGILAACIAAFSGGLLLILLPLVAAVIAKLLKDGVNAICA